MKTACAAIALGAVVLTQAPRTLEDVVEHEMMAVPRPPLPRDVGAIEVGDSGGVGSKDERGNVLAWWTNTPPNDRDETLHLFAIDRRMAPSRREHQGIGLAAEVPDARPERTAGTRSCPAAPGQLAVGATP